MITATIDAVTVQDNTKELIEECGPEMVSLVKAAMVAGLTEFTTPTPKPDEVRIDWEVRQWVSLREGKLQCFLVARRVKNAHFEILGPEIVLPQPQFNLATPAQPKSEAKK